jgi:hypothetical protein
MLTVTALKKAAYIRGYRVEHYVFDCGDTLLVYDGSIVIVQMTRECGDYQTAAEAVAEWMVSKGLLAVRDFD